MAFDKALVIGASGLVGKALMRVLKTAHTDAVGTYAKFPGAGLEVADVGAGVGL